MSDGSLKEWDRIIIGIDPGTNVMGYGILGVKARKPAMIAMGVIQLSRFESHYLRLRRIYDRVLGLVEQYLPDEMAIEAPFFGKNVQSMLKLGRAQGVAMAAALARDVPITEYEPRKIKMAITGQRCRRQGAGTGDVAAHTRHTARGSAAATRRHRRLRRRTVSLLRVAAASDRRRPQVVEGLHSQESRPSPLITV